MKTLKKITLPLLSVLVMLSLATLTAQAQNNEMFASIRKSDAGMIHNLASKGLDVNKTDKVGNSPLFYASIIGDGEVIQTLLSHGADPNFQNRVGATALMIAAKYDNPYTVEMLLQAGADPVLETKDGFKASTFALGYKHYDLGNKLIEAERIALKNKRIERKKAKKTKTKFATND